MKQPVIPQERPKEYLGEFVGKVENTGDPKGLLRVQVRVFPFFEGVPVSTLPWAEYKLPVGARAGEGVFTPVKEGDWVWVDFPYRGDTRRPRITGSVHFCPGEAPNLPHDAWEGPNAYSHQRIAGEPFPANPEYHDGAIVLDENGALIEITRDSSVRVTQKGTGAALEVTPDGKVVIYGPNKVLINGGAGELKGIVQGHCICPFTNQPHIMVSETVEGSP